MDEINASSQQDRRHHRHHRRHRLPDQHPGAERRGRGGTCRRAGPRLRRRRRRGAQPGPAQRRGGARDQGPDRQPASTASRTVRRLVGEAGSTMDEIVASVQRVTDIIAEIAAAAAEQSQGIGQVNTRRDRARPHDAAERRPGRGIGRRRREPEGAGARAGRVGERVPHRSGAGRPGHAAGQAGSGPSCGNHHAGATGAGDDAADASGSAAPGPRHPRRDGRQVRRAAAAPAPASSAIGARATRATAATATDDDWETF